MRIRSLSGINAPDFFIGRGEKNSPIARPSPSAGDSTFTTYTYDAAIYSRPGGFGYRYRWVGAGWRFCPSSTLKLFRLVSPMQLPAFMMETVVRQCLDVSRSTVDDSPNP